MSDYYHDDPVEEETSGRFPSKFIASVAVIFASVFFFQSTLASNISINSGQNIEFGQAVNATAACSGSENLTVTPNSSFVNEADGTGTHYLSSVKVAGIPASCEGKDFVISFYDSATGSSALPIFGENKNVATVYNNAGTFEQGFQGTGTLVSSASGAFTVTFMSPVARSIDAMKVTLQSTEHKDWAIASIAGGQSSTCTLLNSSAVKCWGFNEQGQLGDGTTALFRATPVTVSGLSSGVRTISNRYDHACAIVVTGTVKCWGWNASGQLGDNTTTSSNTPVTVSGLSGVSAISVGNGHSCALLRTGALKCWGGGGKTGDGTDVDRTVPVDVFGLSSGVIAISAAGYHTCALLSTGAVKCWGSDDNGTIGNGGGGDSTKPGGAISGFSASVIALAAGERHNCALLSTGGVQCFGQNGNGQLGNNTTNSSSTPVTVSGISSAVAISANGWTSCALLSSGEAKCWGRNNEGQLGDNSTTQSLTPVTVSGLSSAVAIGSGYNHTCALLSSGAAKCWGSNEWRQLGDGTDTQRLVPTSVTGIP